MPLPVQFDRSSPARFVVAIASLAIIVGSLLPGAASAIDAPDHLVVSEIVTGGTSASDELVELYNPTPVALPLEGIELVYVSSTGATITRRAAWSVGAPSVPSAGHVLVANEAGIYASVADAVYASGMAATGGSVALRIVGASSAIDAVGWGTTVSTWREGANAVAPAAGASIERLPGGALGSTQDTDDNGADFVERLMPEPQNLASPPTPDAGNPSASPVPTSVPTSVASVEPTIDVTATPSPSIAATPNPAPTASPPGVVSVADARTAPDGTSVTVEATALTASDFHDGGGFVADASGGVAVLLEDGAFARGERMRITGELDNRFSQRTLRSVAADVIALGPGIEPLPLAVATGSVDEADEGSLVSISGNLVGGASVLTTGTAFDLDDGSGVVRVVVQSETGIDLAAWAAGALIELTGVVGQRDSTGTGTEGYRVMPRDAEDVRFVADPATPTPSPTPSASSSTGATPAPSGNPDGVLTIDAARDAAKNARLRIRGVVTLPSGVVDDQTAVVQDPTGAIVLRLSEEAGALLLGEWVEVGGTRSTKGGMETLRVTDAPLRLGTAPAPAPTAVRTGGAGEAHEALLVVAAGAIVANARQASSGSISFEIDDGTGPLRVSIGSALAASDESWTFGTWVEVIGALGQETTGAQPLRGYRIWPRTTGDVHVVAAATEGDVSSADEDGPGDGDLDLVGGADASGARIAATLVAGRWPELGIGGLLWDGSRLVAIAEQSAGAVTAIRGSRPLPLALELAGLSSAGTEPSTGATIVALGSGVGELLIGSGPPAVPRSSLAGDRPAWVSLVGRLEQAGAILRLSGKRVPIERHCAAQDGLSAGTVAVLGVAAGDPVRLLVPCGGMTPAPAVALGASIAGGDPAIRSGDAVLSSAQRTSEAPIQTVLVAVLLALGALLLGGTSAWYWRRGRTTPADEADAADEQAAERASVAARLTLVSVPREHGP